MGNKNKILPFLHIILSIKDFYNSKFILMATCLGTNDVVVTRVNCINNMYFEKVDDQIYPTECHCDISLMMRRSPKRTKNMFVILAALELRMRLRARKTSLCSRRSIPPHPPPTHSSKAASALVLLSLCVCGLVWRLYCP